MQDSYGDGWNGADIEVYINGFFEKSMTIPNGFSATDSVLSYEGDNLDFYFNSGTWDHEITFDVYDPLGNLLGSYGTSPNTGNFLSHISNSSCCGSNLSLDPGNNRAICEGSSTQIGGSPTIDNQLVNSTFSFSWSPSSNISNTSATNPTVNPTSTQTYYLDIQRVDSTGKSCYKSDSVTVFVNTLPTVVLNNLNDVCISSSSFLLSGGVPSGGVTQEMESQIIILILRLLVWGHTQ